MKARISFYQGSDDIPFCFLDQHPVFVQDLEKRGQLLNGKAMLKLDPLNSVTVEEGNYIFCGCI